MMAHDARKSSYGQFILRLGSELWRHEDVRRNLRLNWKWDGNAEDRISLLSEEDKYNIRTYMSMYERVQVLIKKGTVATNIFEQLYGYNLFILVRHPYARKEMTRHSNAWSDFIELYKKVHDLREARKGEFPRGYTRIPDEELVITRPPASDDD